MVQVLLHDWRNLGFGSRPIRLLLAIVPLRLTVLVANCGSPGELAAWSATERSEITLFKTSLLSAQQAVRLTNSEATISIRSKEELQTILGLTEKALDAARGVSDAVLAKIHPEMRNHYRDEFERALELRIGSLHNLITGVPDIKGQLAWQAAMKQWDDWYILNQAKVRTAISR